MTVTVQLRPAALPMFRHATVDDVAAIQMLVTSAYRGEASRKGWTTEADLLDGQRIDRETVAGIIDKPDSLVILAERAADTVAASARLIACCHIEKHDDHCYFGMFSVEPGLQGGGIGKRMLHEAERVARQDFHSPEMQMTVISARDELIAWYQRHGYRRSGVYKPFPYGDERFGIPKRADLRFELLVKSL